jgi:hypothetical protein
MRKGRVVVVTVVVALVASIGFMAGVGAAAEPGSAPSGEDTAGEAVTYVGKVKGLGASLALVVEGEAAFGYLCDGEAISEWFRGSVSEGGVSLASADGSTLIAEVRGAKLRGDVFVGDATGRFTLKPATGDAGLFRLEQVIDGIGYAAGWVVQPNGGTVGQVSIAALPDGGVVETPPLLTELPKTIDTAITDGALGRVAPFEVVAQLPPDPPPENEVVAVPTSTGVVTDTGADDSGGGNPGQTQDDTSGGPPPTEPPVTKGGCQELIDELNFQQTLLANLNKAIEDADRKHQVQRKTLLQGAARKAQKEIDFLQEQIDDDGC